MSTLLLSHALNSDVSLEIRQGDLTLESVDANRERRQRLSSHGGGLPALSSAGVVRSSRRKATPG